MDGAERFGCRICLYAGGGADEKGFERVPVICLVARSNRKVAELV